MKRRSHIAYLLVLLALVALILWALTTGASNQSVADTWQTLVAHHQTTYYHTLMTIRLPRIVAALVAGAALAVAGAFFQATLRNAIADPSILGVAAGADLFVMLAGLLLPSLALRNFIGALLGGLVSLALLVHFDHRANPYKLILIGVALNTMFVGIKTLFVQPGTVATSQSLATITWHNALGMIGLGVIGLIVALLLAPWANYLKIGDAQLATIGLPVRRIRVILLVLAALLTSTTTAAIGIIPFIGIIVPHLSRWCVGHDYREVVPFATLLGAAVLLAVDTLGRTLVMPNEIAAATILAVIGGPALIVILAKKGIYNGD
ncbi:iron ABC transporter permease [Lacticaseibacillus sp. GG6-2]